MVSIVVPALNEENYLPRLLDSLDKQSLAPGEVIVADAGSTDRTADLARDFGCLVVQGGNPACGRNSGARQAQGEYLLFLDADVMLEKAFLHDLMVRVRERNLDVASGFITPDSGRRLDRFLLLVSNWYSYLIQRLSPHGSGFYILARKSLHDEIGGFNEELFLAEDHDYLIRAARRGRFAFLTHPRVIFSVRRFEREGRWTMVWKYFVLEIYRAFKKDVKSKVVSYDFGKF